MALSDTPLITLFPTNLGVVNPSLVTFDLDGTTDGACFVWMANDTGEINRCVVYAAITGTSPTYAFAVEGVSAQAPDGTAIGGGSPVSTTSQLSNGWNTITFDNAFNPSVGTTYALTVRYSSGTIDVSNMATINLRVNEPASYQNAPWGMELAAGSWSGNPRRTCIAPLRTDGTYPTGASPIEAITDTPTGTGTEPLWKGNAFTLPFGCRIIGFAGYIRASTTSDFEIHIYNATTDVVGTAVDTSVALGSSFGAPFWVTCAPTSLSASTAYRCVFEPTTANAFTDCLRFDFISANGRAASFPQIYASTSNSGTPSWSDNTSSLYLLTPVIDQIDVAAASGSQGISQGLHTLDGGIVA